MQLINSGRKEKGMNKKLALVAGGILSLGLTTSSFGALLVQFGSEPVSDSLKEIQWTGTQLDEMAGSLKTGWRGDISNYDGTATTDNQVIGGLSIHTPLSVSGVTGSALNADGSTSFYDVQLELSGFLKDGPASPVAVGVPMTVQSLKVGSFVFKGTDDTKLLEGTITASVLFGIDGGSIASVQSTNVTYTGGKIFDQLVANNGTSTGTLSWSLSDLSRGFGVENGTVAGFAANLTGMFSTPRIPEPATLSLVGLGSLGLLRRRNRR